MSALPRSIVPEILDELSAEDPRAQRSRRDLRTVHSVMRSPAILGGLIERLALPAAPLRIIELGAGDGSLLLRVAPGLRPRPACVELTLLDRMDLLTQDTRAAYRRLGWEACAVRADALDWAREPAGERFHLCVVSLFLHHFAEPALQVLLRGIARRADALVCIEPRRSTLARLAARCIGLIGAGEVTRSDSVASVNAGFRGRELGRAWEGAVGGPRWEVGEFAAFPFTHCFIAHVVHR